MTIKTADTKFPNTNKLNAMSKNDKALYIKMRSKIIEVITLAWDTDLIYKNIKEGKLGTDLMQLKKKEIDFVIDLAYEHIEKMSEAQESHAYSVEIRKLDDLYRRSLIEKDYHNCADIIMKKSKIMGIGETNSTKQNVTSSGEVSLKHEYVMLGDRDDVQINLEEYGVNDTPFPQD